MSGRDAFAARDAWHGEHDAFRLGGGSRGSASAASGLVSVPTSGHANFGLREDLILANLKASTSELKQHVGAFELDKEARRLSMLRMAVGFASRCHAVSTKGRRNDKAWMVTLTYRNGVHWQPRHLSDALKHMRSWCKKRAIPFRYLWIGEIQDGKRTSDGVGRDVIHYHVGLWLPVKTRCPHFDARGWWPHGMSQSKLMTSPTGYFMSYLKKDKDLSAMPKGARAYGVGGLDHSLRRSRRWLRLPSFVQANSSIHDKWNRAVGGGWTAPGGKHVASEFRSVVVGGKRCLVHVAQHQRSIEAAGPFSWLTDREFALSKTH